MQFLHRESLMLHNKERKEFRYILSIHMTKNERKLYNSYVEEYSARNVYTTSSFFASAVAILNDCYRKTAACVAHYSSRPNDPLIQSNQSIVSRERREEISSYMIHKCKCIYVFDCSIQANLDASSSSIVASDLVIGDEFQL